jgi:hypothetical protein
VQAAAANMLCRTTLLLSEIIANIVIKFDVQASQVHNTLGELQYSGGASSRQRCDSTTPLVQEQCNTVEYYKIICK